MYIFSDSYCCVHSLAMVEGCDVIFVVLAGSFGLIERYVYTWEHEEEKNREKETQKKGRN